MMNNLRVLAKHLCAIYIIIGVAVASVFSSCGGRAVGGIPAGDTLKMMYAEHITIVRHDGFRIVELHNPWKPNAVLHRYALVDRKDSARVMNSGVDFSGMTVVYTPVTNSVVFTSPHCWLLCALGASNTISGVCDFSYINIPWIQKSVKSGAVADCGNSMSPTVERIISLKPQAIFVSPFEGASYGQIDHIGVPVIECADYMETSALGRAEWMRFYGMLVGKEQEADSMFAKVVKGYREGTALARRSHVRPKVLTERVVSGVWYCPGGNSSMGRLIGDAGGQYVFADDAHSGSLTLSPERVVSDASDAGCWLFVYGGKSAPNGAQLIAEFPGYKLLKAFREGGVYGCGSDTGVPYFEEVSFRPDYLLMDFVRIFHPDLRLNGTTRYYKHVKLQ